MILADTGSMRGAPDSLALFERSLAVSEGDPALMGLRLLTLANQADELVSLDRLAEAEQSAQHLRQVAESTGNVLREAHAQAILGVILFFSGRWDDALAEIDASKGQHFFSHEAYVRGVAAIIALHRGRSGAANSHLAAADAHVERAGGPIISLHFLGRILELDHAGNSERALRLVTDALAEATDGIEDVEGWLAEAVRLAMRVGDLATAAAVTERADAIGNLGAVAHRRAIALHCRGQLDGDPDLLRQAADDYDRAGWTLPGSRPSRRRRWSSPAAATWVAPGRWPRKP